MSKIGMTSSAAQAVEVPDSSIEEQINGLHVSLDVLANEMGDLRENLSEVLCPTSEQETNGLLETPVMSITAERIFTAQARVSDLFVLVQWINENLNIKGGSK